MTARRAPVALPVDGLGAFVGPPALLAEGAPEGPLAGCTLGVKDLFDVAGTVTGAGNPDFAAGRAPARAHALAVDRLVRAGASVVGKTVTDELAYSLSGTNVHHGTPRNVAAPGRTPGGSSAGSAAAVGAGLVDLALGTDTGGSIRVPASYCGTYGWRPTHGAVPIDGVVPLAPSFDTVGLFARDPALLAAAAGVLLDLGDGGGSGAGPVSGNGGRAGGGAGDGSRARVGAGAGAGGRAPTTVTPPRLRWIAEATARLPPMLATGLVARLHELGPDVDVVELGLDLDDAAGAFRALQGRQAWTAHGTWITDARPTFGPGVAARFRAASQVTDEEVAAANAVRATVAAAVLAATADGTVLAMPAAAGPAPRLRTSSQEHDRQRADTLRLTCIAGLAGAPVVVAPLLRADGLPFGLALVGAPGTDRDLLAIAATTAPS